MTRRVLPRGISSALALAPVLVALVAAAALLAVIGGIAAPEALAGDDKPAGPAPAAKRPSILETAKRYVEAFRAKDEATLVEIAASKERDSFLTAAAIFSLYAEAALAAPSESYKGTWTSALAAARDFAGRAGRAPGCEGLAALVEKWADYSGSDLRREMRVREAHLKTSAAIGRAAWKEALDAATGASEDVRPDELSPSAWGVRFHLAAALASLGRLGEGCEAFEGAGRRAEAIGWAAAAADSWNQAWMTGSRIGDFRAAREAAQRAVAAFERLARSHDAARLRVGLAVAENRTGRPREALESVRRARADALAAGDAGLAASALSVESNARQAMGDDHGAIEAATRAVAEFRAVGDPAGVVTSLVGLASAHLEADRYAEAIAAFEEALAVPGALAEPTNATALLGNLGAVERRIGHLDRSLELRQRSLAAARQTGRSDLVAQAQGNVATVLLDLGRSDEGLTMLREALAEKRSAGDRRGAAETLANTAIALRRLARFPEAIAAAREAVAEFSSLREVRPRAQALTTLGNSLLSSGDVDAALEADREAIALLGESGDRTHVEADARESLAGALLAAGRPAEAVESARRSMDLRGQLVRGLGDEDALGLRGGVRVAADLGVEAAVELAKVEGHGDEAGGIAFEFMESGRGLLLAEGLVNADALLLANLPPPLLELDAATRARVAAARSALVVALARSAEAGGGVDRLRRELAAAWSVREETVARIQREAHRVASVVYPRPADAAALAKGLRAGEAFVAYHLGSRSAVAVVVTPQSVRFVPLGDAPSIAAAAEGWLRLVSSPGGAEQELSERLYERLVRPVEGALLGSSRLVISPDGVLAFLPFAALSRRDGEKTERLVERFETALVPSATVYLALLAERSATPGDGLVALADPADPAPGFSALPESRAEASAIAALFPEDRRAVLVGDRATPSGLSEALAAAKGRLRAVHLAGHAFIDPEHPRRSGFALAGGEVLDVDSVYRLHIPADLAVLSACETARGTIAKGEGPLGFVRGLFFAGVPRIVATAWRVPETGTRRLVVRFYEGLVRDGLPASAALRAAQLERLRSGGAEAHPYGWGAFLLWGLPE